jgi:predicted nuclease of predicted toxin-antitoxin system
MKILVDENIPRMTVDRLRELGHEVRDVRGTPRLD